MGDRAKGVSKIEPGAVESFFIFPSMEKKGVQDSAVLNAAIDKRKAFWRVGSISLFVRRKDWKREARMR